MTDEEIRQIVIIGGGHAAAQLCASLRKDGFSGDIVLVSDEEAIPYHRPPLSKAYLKGTLERSRLWIRPESFYADQDVSLRLGGAVTVLDRTQKYVELISGEKVPYDRLIFATGGRARPLPVPGHDLPVVHSVRSIHDIDSMKSAFDEAPRIVVIGGGFIGLEAAAVAKSLGKQVTVIEREPQILARVCHKLIAERIQSLHEAEGVTFQLSTNLQQIEVAPTNDSGAIVATNRGKIDADLIIAGIGILPNDDLARQAGLDCDHGICCDLFCRTSDPHIYATGDVAVFPSIHQGHATRVESVQNATDMAKIASANLMGQSVEHTSLPWFWSEQFDWKLQMAGLAPSFDRLEWREGEKAHHGSLAFFQDGKLLRIDAIGAARHYVRGKKLIEQSADIEAVENLLGPADFIEA